MNGRWMAAVRVCDARCRVGTWYSSLGTLGELPIEAVKLDQSFVRGVGSDLENDTIVVCIDGEGFTSVAGETAPLERT